MITRRQRRRSTSKPWSLSNKNIIYIILAMLLILGGLWRGTGNGNESIAVISKEASFKLPKSSWSILPPWKDILISGIPGMARVGSGELSAAKPEFNMKNVGRNALLVLTDIDIFDIRSLLQVEMPLLGGLLPNSISTVHAVALPNLPRLSPVIMGSKPLVAIYHTHTAESFIPSSGAPHKPGGQRGDIVEVGAALEKRLNQYGIMALHNQTIHDYPSFMKAYGASEVTLKKILAENPSVQMVFDIHRDAGKREEQTVVINGISMARISIVVATGQVDLVQPHWQQNHAFAKSIETKMNQYFPGLSRGIQLVDWRYNQHLHPKALLIEIGCQENSKEEALRSVEALGDILVELINENNTQ